MRLPSLLGPLLIVAMANALFAEDVAQPTPEQTRQFESKVRPLLVARCFSCHGPEKQKSGLRLDSRDAILAGGESGSAFDAEQPANSLLIDAIRYESLQMPPDRKLSDAEIEILTDWFKQGAPWPGAPSGAVAVRKRGLEITDEDRKFWSFQPVRRPAVPTVKHADRVRDPIDAFVIQKLEEQGLAPSPSAGRRELIRRLSFDLLGLPPSPEEVDRFVADNAPDAVERLVDDYLSRPEYGERWGRHWLDLVRFAQSNGYERDDEKPNAWRYRDYVIQSLNEDKPYDQFLREQLAGDELDQLTDAGRIALGFYRLGVWDDEPDDERQADFDELDDMLSTTGSVFLGLTIGCARCHDHKFDPIAQDDYYSLLAFLRNVKPYTKPENKPEGVIFGDLAAGGKALTVFDSPDALKTHVLARGSAASPGKEVEPRFLKVLSTNPAGDVPTVSVAGLEHVKSSGRRRALAEWIASDRHPLTARVIVNRLWHYHFGRGLVPTPNDFGHTGLPPTHPALLDYLAGELVTQGWRLKPLHRLIVLSATYRQSSATDNAMALAVDPGNNFLWRQNLRRLEAEAIRDAILATTGSLNRQMTGRGIFPQLPPEVLATQSQPGRGWDQSSPAERARRSVYIFSKRTLGVPILESFDQASTDSSQAARNTTTIAPQALILLNSQFTDEQSQAFADRLIHETGSDPQTWVERAFRLALGRQPTPKESQTALSYIDRQRAHFRELPVAPVEVAKSPTNQSLNGWTTYHGDWSLREDGGYRVAPHPGAKALWNELVFTDGEINAEVWIGEGQDAGLLIRASDATDGVDSVRAYNINFATGAGRLRLGKHLNDWRSLAEVRAGWKRGAWQQVRIVATGPRLQIYLNGSKEPLIDFTDPEPLLGGQIGFRTFQADAAVRAIGVQSAAGRQEIPLLPATTATAATTIDHT
ncbi:MAG: DUF1553 domain-containing protein, partial [Planctomycetaceae bacterium]|nr:DUF1553 domain-containing protein [Planctomycetaceae bacterium]